MKQDNNIESGLNALFGGKSEKPVEERAQSSFTLHGHGRPRKEDAADDAEYMRTSLIVNKRTYDKLREIALKESITLKDMIHFSFELAIEKYEAKNGKVEIASRDKKKEELFGL